MSQCASNRSTPVDLYDRLVTEDGGDPLVSVVIPVHNGEDLIERAIESVLQQTCPHFELIVVDDGSTDGTAEIVERWCARDERVRLLQLSPASGGPAKPRNTAIAISSAEFIALLDHDDVWSHDKLRLQIARLGFTSADVCYSRCTVDDVEAGVSIDIDFHRRWTPLIERLPEGDIVEALLGADVVPCSTAVFRRELMGRIGGFAEDLFGLEDYELWLRASLAGASFCAVEDTTMVYRWSSTSLSHQIKERRAELTLRMWSRLAASHPRDRRLRGKAQMARDALARQLIRSTTSPGRSRLERARGLRRLASLRPPISVLGGEVARMVRGLRRRLGRILRPRAKGAS